MCSLKDVKHPAKYDFFVYMGFEFKKKQCAVFKHSDSQRFHSNHSFQSPILKYNSITSTLKIFFSCHYLRFETAVTTHLPQFQENK